MQCVWCTSFSFHQFHNQFLVNLSKNLQFKSFTISSCSSHNTCLSVVQMSTYIRTGHCAQPRNTLTFIADDENQAVSQASLHVDVVLPAQAYYLNLKQGWNLIGAPVTSDLFAGEILLQIMAEV